MTRIISYAVVAIGAFSTANAIALAGGLQGLLSGYGIWALMPYLALAVALYRASGRAYAIVWQIVTALAVAFAVYAYREAFQHPDAQGALVFLFVPFYQLAAIVIVSVLAALARRIQRLRA